MGTCCESVALSDQEIDYGKPEVKPKTTEKPVCIMRIRAKLYVYGDGKWGERGTGDAQLFRDNG